MDMNPSPEELAALATGRRSSLFAADVARHAEELRARLGGKRLLVIGGAGSIGSATLRALLRFEPALVHVVDQDENGLAELVRDLRSDPGSALLPRTELCTLPVDFGSPLMRRFLGEHPKWDYVFNFAALKHVRSEKDACSLLQMLETNVLKAARLLGWLRDGDLTGGYFSVSTDKAANPVSLMGASKRLMEHVIFSGASSFKVTSARFANVAFSNGSLLASFLERLRKGQPLASPAGTRRYFVSPREAGEICLLAAVLAPDRRVLIPALDPSKDLRLIEDVAKAVLERHGFSAEVYRDEAAAKAAVQADIARKRYPLLLTPLDTSGEKEFEEFLGAGEASEDAGFAALKAIRAAEPPKGLPAFLSRLSALIDQPEAPIGKDALRAWISELLPELAHRETGRTLDARM